jgi:DNA relaxase NicK
MHILADSRLCANNQSQDNPILGPRGKAKPTQRPQDAIFDNGTSEQILAYDFDKILQKNLLGYVDPALILAMAQAVPPSNNMGVNPPLTPYFFPQCEKSPSFGVQKSSIDWCAFSAIIELDPLLIGLQIIFPEVILTSTHAGMKGYPNCKALQVGTVQYGLVGYGAAHGRVSVSLTGTACKLLTDEKIENLHELLTIFDARLTRVDICFDFFQGEITFDAAVWAYDQGDFKNPIIQKNPQRALILGNGGRGENLGRTMYLGPRTGEVYGRVYEKGLEVFAKMPEFYREQCTEREYQNDPNFNNPGTIADSWVRLEVEFKRKAKNRPLVLDMLLDRDAYFSGAYPFFAKAIQSSTSKGRGSLKENNVICHDKLFMAHKRSYGNHVHSLRDIGLSDKEICDSLDSGVHCQKLLKAGLISIERKAVDDWKANNQDFDIPF